MRVIVIGAGITGLTTAWAAAQAGASVTVLEASSRVGGAIATMHDRGYIAELGPGSMVETPVVAALIAELGLTGERVIPSPTAKRRYVIRGGKPIPVPLSPPALFRSRLLTPAGKLRVLAEPFIGRGRDSNESVAEFTRRRFGPEALDYLVNPLMAGVHAGDPAQLAARYACAPLVDLEYRYGSVLIGAMRSRPAPRAIISFRHGLETLPRAIAHRLGPSIRLEARVRAIDQARGRWTVQTDRDAQIADAVVYTGSAPALSQIGWPRAIKHNLLSVMSMPTAPVVTLSLGFPRDAVAHPLDGFGVLVPAVETASLLGVFFASAVFGWRAPTGHVLLTCFMGGSRSPQLVAAPEPALVERARRDLRQFLGIDAAPTFVRCTRWPDGIPQYDTAYHEVTNAIDGIQAHWPGLHLAGAFRHGISIPDRITAGLALGRSLVSDSAP